MDFLILREKKFRGFFCGEGGGVKKKSLKKSLKNCLSKLKKNFLKRF